MCTTALSYTARCYAELNNDVTEMNFANSQQPVWVRTLTAEELQAIREDNEYIKNIGRAIDGKEWRLLSDEKNPD